MKPPVSPLFLLNLRRTDGIRRKTARFGASYLHKDKKGLIACASSPARPAAAN